MRLSKISTKTGDTGKSALAKGERLDKHDPFFEVLGDLDELNAWVGHIRSSNDVKDIDKKLESIQQDLFNLGGEISLKGEHSLFDEIRTKELESDIENWNEKLPPLKEFILPGGEEILSRMHIARTVCRRSERKISKLDHSLPHYEKWIPYINRLSDWFFVLARYINSQSDQSETMWNRE
ncbi:MAG: cob(I)yrinic acid a,c-diamide adenosyltransferase [Candidatus Marinimicrobia bacterium]|nr:cob(I)yrinic acid a,c-diamide adenosyltransferase [Candidatus Neomarinimicrobiota bacterium]